MPEAYAVRLDVFSGPLDLLLHLIEKQELDITTVSLAQVADQFLAYVESAADLTSEILADFLVVASKLLYIKSATLLPKPPSIDQDEEELVGDDLVKRLREYRRIKAAAAFLHELEERGLRTFARIAPAPLPTGPVTLEGLDLAGLLAAARAALQVLPPAPPVNGVVSALTVTVGDRLAHVRRALRRARQITFGALVRRARSRMEVIVTLLAVLEMVKRREADVQQETPFGEIVITALPMIDAVVSAPELDPDS